ncbi:23S rRNA (guanosine(2251)-2'-O)-methyltransferase RlmB [Lentiprolixibacter aurantiacus]|uniref:23S rRNA (Guanosine(2251)-2'-O)-methyltransferase RlmB n=1 Tax=Lentiprolixibacter aurantiacus TaxID=2993939 RepID=A0AAE3MMU1_9FLAO|nr:23S rRNA (guanosine(2251)-2'-O)-methyltransferase RlmB [Lentiprolixibacter aurantiacus]MCX2720695.1 23S rRNA (guanosine(2251)-2'-O)-methyltransferase RlmB [Lentiprolixibacter aurantiacus]
MQKSQFIYGLRAIIEAIDSETAINKVYLQKGLGGELFVQLENKLRKAGITTSYVPFQKLNKLVRGNHQGAVATVSPVSFSVFEELVDQVCASKKTPLFLLLDRVSDVRNFGAIIRTAVCTGVDGIIVPSSGSAPVTSDTVKTSAGAVFNIPIAKVNHMKDAVYYLQASGVNVVAATEKTTNTLFDLDLKKPLAIIMGAEDKGISPAVLKIVDHLAQIPMAGSIASLNVSVACGVFLYETVRQRGA